MKQIMAERIIQVRVSAGAKTEKFEKIADGIFKARVSAPPEKGKANTRVLEMVAEYFKIPQSRVVLVSGTVYREKIIHVDL